VIRPLHFLLIDELHSGAIVLSVCVVLLLHDFVRFLLLCGGS